ncbi:AAA family ATPase [Nonomuraea sp. NN258]|uniref:helix-turn-helix transcriptional regulator n=1 Tax=Nonomuraea antri TaxID=2730852 RepID=UPI001567D2AA|nr:LuxR family transcriptional regulator [Nonomuraea antri]NRQ33647.1 AAA family ATPase [Nonomuraea antri]
MLYGRADEQRVIEDLLRRARQGGSAVLVITGEPGVGKSALADHAVASADGFTALRGSGVESEAELPYAGLHQLLLPALGALDRLPELQAAALRRALGLTHPGGAEKAAGDDRFLVGVATLSLLAEVAEPEPLLCVVDDAQWLDRASRDALLFAARRLRAEGVVLIFVARPEFDADGLPGLPLTGLGGAAARELLAARAPDLAADVRERILAEAEGNPLGLIELPLSAESAPELGPLPLTRRLQDAFHHRVARLPEPARALLLVASAEDTGELRVIMSAAARAFDVDESALETCEEADLVRVRGTTLSFRHPLARSAVYQAAGFARRRAAHRALAEVSGPERGIWHLAIAASGPDERLAGELERAAAGFRLRTGYAAASAVLERAAALSDDAEARGRRLADAADAALTAGQLDRAWQLTTQELDRTRSGGETRLRLANIRADVEFERGKLADASDTLLKAARPPAGVADAPARTLLLQAVRNAWYAHDLALAREATALLAGLRHDDDPLRPLMAMAEGMTALLAGRPGVALPLLRRVVAGGRLAEEGLYGLRNNAAQTALLVGDHESATAIARLLASECTSLGMIGWLPHTHLLLAWADVMAGRHREAAAEAEAGERIAVQTGQAHLEAQLCGVRAWLAAVAGDARACGELAGRASAVPHGRAWAGWALGLLDLGLGRYDAALDRLEPVSAHHPAAVADLVEAAVRSGAPERAAGPLAAFADWVPAAEQPWARAVLDRCLALTSDDEAAHVAATATDQPFDQARARLLHGERLRRERHKQEARTPLRAAAETFDRLGARPWAERAAAELRATGETLTRDSDADLLGRLTPQELQVVRLAATGATNKEIAAQLFLSPRTVGHHLYNAYPKLGVSTRTELARLTLS